MLLHFSIDVLPPQPSVLDGLGLGKFRVKGVAAAIFAALARGMARIPAGQKALDAGNNAAPAGV
jgi:hypothetical protein